MAARTLDDVYGISRDLPLNYITRDDVDGTLVENLARGKHLIVFGSSKQGKTSLRKYNLLETDHIVVMCSNKWGIGQLLTSILKEAGFTTEQSTTLTQQGSHKISAKISGKIKTPVADIGAEVGGDEGHQDTISTTEAVLELDPEDVNDIIRCLDEIGFDQYIVLEDFHYLPEDTQEDFAVALKAFHENSNLNFLVIGVWLDENRLVQYNGDLSGRLTTIDADKWHQDDLEEVVTEGGRLLNITFDPLVVDQVIAGSFNSVYVVQEAFHHICKTEGILYANDGPRKNVGEGLDVGRLLRDVVDQDTARYRSFIENFSNGFKPAELEMYRHLMRIVLLSDLERLRVGLTYKEIRDALAEVHPHGSSLNPGNVTQALKYVGSLQVSRLKIKPIVLDYDQSNRLLGVVDRGFLIWLQHQDREELAAEIQYDPSTPAATVS